jgi:hypothetical protein
MSERKFLPEDHGPLRDGDRLRPGRRRPTKRFFATVQNKLHWAIHGQTAAEVIVNRADATK